jgi:hypothetical protein
MLARRSSRSTAHTSSTEASQPSATRNRVNAFEARVTVNALISYSPASALDKRNHVRSGGNSDGRRNTCVCIAPGNRFNSPFCVLASYSAP